MRFPIFQLINSWCLPCLLLIGVSTIASGQPLANPISPNVPVLVTTTTGTRIISTILNSHNSPNCSGPVTRTNGCTGGGCGFFLVATGTHTYYLSTGEGQPGPVSNALCPGGTTTLSMDIDLSQTSSNIGVCTQTTGCVTATCGDGGFVTSVSSNLTLTCP